MVVAVEVGEEEEDPRNFSRLPEKLMSLLVDGEAGATSLRKAKERPRTSFNLIVRINPSFVTEECNITYIIRGEAQLESSRSYISAASWCRSCCYTSY